ncbi:MAG: MliC family protein, partial [Candidatus Binatia bacterium]
LRAFVMTSIAKTSSITGALILAACASRPSSESVSAPQDHLLSYSCADGYTFTVELDASGNRGRVNHAGGSVEVMHVVSASGAKYRSDDVIYWSKGDEALLETSEGLHKFCRVGDSRIRLNNGNEG